VPDEVNASFLLPGEPAANVSAWRATQPPFLDGYKRIDESYESLVYEADVTSGFMKVAMFGFGKTLYRLTFTFRPTDDGATQVGVLGQAHEDTLAAMSQWATSHAPG
jgi:hypothetical protein